MSTIGPSKQISVVVNGRQCRTAASVLSDLVAEQIAPDVRVATALNGRFVPIAARATTALGEGDHVEIVSARQGG